MSTQKIANRLSELCKQGDFMKAQKELFADNAVSIEPNATPAFDKETKGLPAIMQKGEKWQGMVEKTHKVSVSDPIITPNSFAMKISMDVTMKERGRMAIEEIAVYNVKDDKIVSEEFFM